MNLVEIQIDRLVGPTLHFGGLGVGNVASQQHAGQESNPAAAALQGLDKMRLVASYGVVQLILPPQSRPRIDFLRSLGFEGTDADVLRRAGDEAPSLLSAATSCSAMWTANAATVTPAVDSVDGGQASKSQRLTEVTIANLVASVHRSIEPHETSDDLRAVLPRRCRLHGPIPGGASLRDEGAANHMRLGSDAWKTGINILVHGDGDPTPRVYWPRQTAAACRTIARLHKLLPENTFLLRQDPRAIDAGAFHNDVVAISHQDLLIYHERAFFDARGTLEQMDRRFTQLTGKPLRRIEVPQSTLSIDDAVATYLFNSQVISPAEDRSQRPVLICPAQVQQHPAAKSLVDQWCNGGLFQQAHFVDLSQSMSGGGGPACLRLRVPLPAEVAQSIPSPPRWSNSLDEQLRGVITQHYATHVTINDLARADFHAQVGNARHRLLQVLRL